MEVDDMRLGRKSICKNGLHTEWTSDLASNGTIQRDELLEKDGQEFGLIQKLFNVFKPSINQICNCFVLSLTQCSTSIQENKKLNMQMTKNLDGYLYQVNRLQQGQLS